MEEYIEKLYREAMYQSNIIKQLSYFDETGVFLVNETQFFYD